MLMSHLTGITVMHVTQISPCTHHLITVITFAVTIYHSLDLSLQTKNPFHKSFPP